MRAETCPPSTISSHQRSEWATAIYVINFGASWMLGDPRPQLPVVFLCLYGMDVTVGGHPFQLSSQILNVGPALRRLKP